MYSERLRELFHSRAHVGKLEDATHYGEAGVPGQGPYIQLWLRVEDNQVKEARFKTYGCPAAIACAESVCIWSEGRELNCLHEVTDADVTSWLGGVPEGKEHCPALAASALAAVQDKG
jgi:nitrogen fixation NifU-like protein